MAKKLKGTFVGWEKYVSVVLRIRELLLKEDRSIAWLAKKINVNPDWLARLLRLGIKPSIEFYRKISPHLDTTPEYLETGRYTMIEDQWKVIRAFKEEIRTKIKGLDDVYARLSELERKLKNPLP